MPDEVRLDSHALDYAAQGLAVFPVVWLNQDGSCGCGDRHCTSPGKHPLTKRGLHDATLDEAQIAAWWDRWPRANIGVATGAVSGRVVVDVDADKGGLVTWDDLQAEHGQVEAATVATGGGGLHLWFEHPGAEIPNRNPMRQGIDFRGDGGYVVVPPSLHSSGRRYEWRVPWSAPEDEAYEDRQLPAWLESMVREKVPKERTLRAFSAEVDDWDGSTPASVEVACQEDGLAGKLFRRDGRMKLAGGNASDCDYALACRLYECGVTDPVELAHGVMASRHRDFEAWNGVRRKSKTYFADTVEQAVAKVEKQRAEAERAKLELHEAWQKPYRWNEIGDSNRFLEMHGSDLVYQPVERRWYVWDGAAFAGDDDRKGGSMAIDLRLRDFLDEYHVIAKFQSSAEARDKAMKYSLSIGTAGRVESIKKLCRPVRAKAEEQLDFEPTLLNATNGVVDLETGKLLPHERAHLMTKMAGGPYMPGVRSKLWESFLEQAIPDEETRDFFGLCVGYSMLGIQPEQRFFFVHGPGATGKSTAIKAIQAAFGSYHRAADFSTFLSQPGKSSSGPSSDMARLARVRMVSAVEVGHGSTLNDGLVKQLSGGDTVTSRKLYGDEQEWTPIMALWLVANDRPKGRVDDDALWRRLVPFLFDQVVPQEQGDVRLTEKLCRPQARVGILAWAVKHARRYLEIGKLELPPACLAGILDYKKSSNPLGDFLEEGVDVNPLAKVKRSDLWKAYRAYCADEEVKTVGKKTFNAIVEDTEGVELIRHAGEMWWRGLSVVGR